MGFPYDLDPYQRDPGGWATSLLHSAELVLGLLDAAQADSVLEVGAFRGELTRLLLRWADEHGATVTAIDPAPHPDLEQLATADAKLTLVRDTSLAALARLEPADVTILDGDHNYHTVSSELELIAERCAAADRRLPLLLLHDVCWPHGRRDDYHVPERIPAEHRQPLARADGAGIDQGLHPGEPGTVYGGLPCDNPAARAGGPRNGVLTAAEDFVGANAQLRLAIIPAFYGLGVIFERDAPYAEPVSRVLDPWDRNPLLARIEANRVRHLSDAHIQFVLARDAHEQIAEQDRQLAQGRELLESLLGSRALRVAELVSRLRRGTPAFSRREIRAAISSQRRLR